MTRTGKERNQIALWLALTVLLSAIAIYLPTAAVDAMSPARNIEADVMAKIAAGPPNIMAASAPAGADGIGLVDTTRGLWHLRTRDGDPGVFWYGVPGDYPFVGDWDCDGVDTPGLYRQSDGYVYLRNSNNGGFADIKFYFGIPNDVPLAGDFNGDGCDTVSLYRPSEARFYIINELGSNDGGLGEADFFFTFGVPGDKPFVGDFDGDGDDTVGLHRESDGTVYFTNKLSHGFADFEFVYGIPNDRLVAGDWTGDGKDSPALFRPSNQTLYLRYTNTAGFANENYTWGKDGHVPVAGSFGTLHTAVNVSLAGAPDGLAYAVESFYAELPYAPNVVQGLRDHLGAYDDRPKSKNITGKAAVDTIRLSSPYWPKPARNQGVAVVTAGSDVLLAVSDNEWEWRIVGAHAASEGKSRWYGGDVRHVVLVGTDYQQNANGTWPDDERRTNADSVHILSLSVPQAKGTITGFPRDTEVNAWFGDVKIAQTTLDRWPDVTTSALIRETDLPLEGFVQISMGTAAGLPDASEGFSDLVDEYGGFPFLVPYSSTGGVAQAGDTFVDGDEALAFARERFLLPHGDVDRTLGQGLLIKAALADVRKSSILTIPALLAILDGYVETDLDADQLLTFAAATYIVDPGPMPTLTAADLDASGHTHGGSIADTHGPYNQNNGSLPNAMVKGCFKPPSSWDLVDGNYETFVDLADGLLTTFPPYHCP